MKSGHVQRGMSCGEEGREAYGDELLIAIFFCVNMELDVLIFKMGNF